MLSFYFGKCETLMRTVLYKKKLKPNMGISDKTIKGDEILIKYLRISKR